jgi:hypothetical protein
MLAFLVLTAVTFSLFGFIIGIWADGFEKLQMVPLLIVTPLTFLGGSFYSIDMLPPVLADGSLFNPVVYLVSGFRWSFYGQADVHIGISLGVTPHRLPVEGLSPERLQEAEQRGDHRLGLLLLHPVAGAVDPVAATQVGQRTGLHGLVRPGHLEHPPVLAAGDEAGRHLDAPSAEQAQLRAVRRIDGAAVPLQPTLQPGACELAAYTASSSSGSQRLAAICSRVGSSGATVSAMPRPRSIT